jgi:hypothetical protein
MGMARTGTAGVFVTVTRRAGRHEGSEESGENLLRAYEDGRCADLDLT